MGLKDMIGSKRVHRTLGKVKVIDVVPKSRTKVVVVCIENAETHRCTRHVDHNGEITHAWSRGTNSQRGFIDDVRVDELK